MRIIARPLAFEARSHLNLSFRFAAGGSGGRAWVKLAIRVRAEKFAFAAKQIGAVSAVYSMRRFRAAPAGALLSRSERACVCASSARRIFAAQIAFWSIGRFGRNVRARGESGRFVEFNKKIRPQKRSDQSYKFSARESKSRFGIFCCRCESRPASPRGITGASRMRPCGKFPFRLRRRRRHS